MDLFCLKLQKFFGDVSDLKILEAADPVDFAVDNITFLNPYDLVDLRVEVDSVFLFVGLFKRATFVLLVVHLLGLPHIFVKCATLSDSLLFLSGFGPHLVNVVLGHEIEFALEIFLAKSVIVDSGQSGDKKRVIFTSSDQDSEAAFKVLVVW